MEQEKKNTEISEEMEAEIVEAEEIAEEAVVETAKEITEETVEESVEETEAAKETAEEAETAEQTEEETAQAPAAKPSWKEKLTAFFKKVNPVVEAEEEPEEAAQEVPEEPAAQEPVQEEEPVLEVPVRRKPADAFIIDFPVEEEPAPQEETAEEPAEAPAEEAVEDLFADEEAEVKPAKKPIKPFLLGLILGGCVVLLGLLGFFVLKGAGIDIGPRPNDVYYKDSYTATHDTLAKKADTVVATIGDKKLTMSELQLYYINSIYAFYSQNYYYMSMMGLDLSQPLDQQYYMGQEGMTWEQFFLDSALQSWQSYTTVEILAEQENFTVSAELQAQIDGIASQLDSIAAAYGYESAQAYLDEEMAPGVTTDVYVNFNRVYCISNEYVSNFYKEEYPNIIEITRYYNDNKDVFQSNGVTQDMGLISSVRHILIQPQGGTADESGNIVYSEDEWTSALSEAERILKQWQEGEATEESFAALANTYSADGGSNTTGGLYEQIHLDSSYVPEFKSWAIDVARKSGDVEIVKTTYGYHIMYFVSGENYFEYLVGEQLVAERIQEKLLAVKAEYPMEVNYKKILLCEGSVM